ncbi:MAG TPA: sulfotransferase domain-containing protein [Bauldia sp.]|nr:sulfotransferase domain-containing protein [Bauldia sp.]
MINIDPKKPRGIVWLASYPKSGNTWLRIFLYHYSRILSGAPREDDELNKLDRSSGYESKLYGLFERLLEKPLAQASRLEVMSVRAQVQLAVAERIDGIVFLKTHNLLGELDGMPTINLAVSAGGVYIVRDPRDVVPSLAQHIGSTIDEAIEVMRTPAFATENEKETAFEIWGSWSEHVDSWGVEPNRSVLVVRYEDMLAKPVESFSAILRHLGSEPKEATLLEAIELSSFEQLKRQEDQGGFRERSPRAERFFVSGKSGGWRDKLTSMQAQAIVEHHRKEMAYFGYLD